MNRLRTLLIGTLAAGTLAGCGSEAEQAAARRVEIVRGADGVSITTGSFVMSVRDDGMMRVSELAFVQGNVFTVRHDLVKNSVAMSERRMTPDAYRDRFAAKGLQYDDTLSAAAGGVSDEARADLAAAHDAVVASVTTPTPADEEAEALTSQLQKAPKDTILTPGQIDDPNESPEGGTLVEHQASASLCWAKNKASVWAHYDATVCSNWWCKVKDFGRNKWIGGSTCFGRCGKGCDWGWLKQRYTQACANHDLCVDDLGYADPRCLNEFAPTLVDAVSATNCG